MMKKQLHVIPEKKRFSSDGFLAGSRFLFDELQLAKMTIDQLSQKILIKKVRAKKQLLDKKVMTKAQEI